MNLRAARNSGIVLVGLLTSSVCGVAQNGAQVVTQRSGSLQSYEIARQSVLQGTVVASTVTSTTAPFGAHLSVRTSSGVMEVHIGNGKLLGANHLKLEPGDAVNITGESMAFGQTAIFAARIIQKGSQTVTLRSPRGIPLAVVSRENGKTGGAQ